MDSVAVVEPQMDGIFHAGFNTALLHAVALAFPDAQVSFLAPPQHLEGVKSALRREAAALADRIAWQELPPPGGGGTWGKLRRNVRVLRSALASSRHIVFCSLSRLQLLGLKALLPKGRHVAVILHGDLDRVERNERPGWVDRIMPLERALAAFNSEELSYVVPGPSILMNLPELLKRRLRVLAIDHPYYFQETQEYARTPPRFGIFGYSGEGRLLEQVAKAVKESRPEVRFQMVGFVRDESAVARLTPAVEFVTSRPISREMFDQRARNVSHALWLAPPDAYRLRASAGFLDALAYCKPIAFTANPFVDYYFALEPEIGIRCRTFEEVAQAICELAAQERDEQYEAARAAMLRLRTRFAPSSVALQLRSGLGWD